MKKLSITLLLTVLAVTLSSCDKHFWSSLSGGTWYATAEVQGNYGVDLYPWQLRHSAILRWRIRQLLLRLPQRIPATIKVG